MTVSCLILAAARLSNFTIDVTNSAYGSFPQQCAFDSVPFTASETRVYICPHGTTGKYVTIRFDSSKSEFLQLCEVQVQGGIIITCMINFILQRSIHTE